MRCLIADGIAVGWLAATGISRVFLLFFSSLCELTDYLIIKQEALNTGGFWGRLGVIEVIGGKMRQKCVLEAKTKCAKDLWSVRMKIGWVFTDYFWL
jgi:hypothetical protein